MTIKGLLEKSGVLDDFEDLCKSRIINSKRDLLPGFGDEDIEHEMTDGLDLDGDSEVDYLGGIVSDKKILTSPAGRRVLVKPDSYYLNMWGRNDTGVKDYSTARNEGLFWKLASSLGMGSSVPTTTSLMTPSGELYSVQEIVEDAEHASGPPQVSLIADPYDRPDLIEGNTRLALLDFILGQYDRHVGNWMEDGHEDRIHLIDNGLSFMSQRPNHMPSYMSFVVYDKPPTPKALEWARKLGIVERTEDTVGRAGGPMRDYLLQFLAARQKKLEDHPDNTHLGKLFGRELGAG